MRFDVLVFKFAFGLVAFTQPASAQQRQVSPHLPPSIHRVLQETLSCTDPSAREAVLAIISKALPELADYLDAFMDAHHASKKKRADENLSHNVMVVEQPDRPEAALLELENPPFPWTGEISVDAAFTSGNTNTNRLGLDLSTTLDRQVYDLTLEAFADFAQADGQQTQRRWGTSGQIDLRFGDWGFGYFRASFEEDAFSGFDNRIFAGGGIGVNLVQRKGLHWKTEIGPGLRSSNPAGRLSTDKVWATYGATELDWSISDVVTLQQEITLTWTEPTTTYLSRSAISAKVMGPISARMSLEYRFESAPPEDQFREDTVMKAGLAYDF